MQFPRRPQEEDAEACNIALGIAKSIRSRLMKQGADGERRIKISQACASLAALHETCTHPTHVLLGIKRIMWQLRHALGENDPLWPQFLAALGEQRWQAAAAARSGLDAGLDDVGTGAQVSRFLMCHEQSFVAQSASTH